MSRIAVVAAVLLLWKDASSEPRLRYVTTARQKGPVGHRDPIGVLSPDGKWVAYSEGRFLKLQRVEGGPVRDFEPMSLDIREIAWFADSRRLAVPDRASGGAGARWFAYDLEAGGRTLLWPGAPEISNVSFGDDGAAVGVLRTPEGFALVRRDSEGRDTRLASTPERMSHPLLRAGRVPCIVGQRLDLDCANATPEAIVDREVYGPFARSSEGETLYFSSPNGGGTLDLWSFRQSDGRLERLTSFARDTYAPSVDDAGRVLFKVQDYRTFLAMAPAAGGETTPLTTFQSETPSWDAAAGRIAFTFGNWRRVLDDLHYPDISQHVGLIRLDAPLPAEAPHGIVSASSSEDQGQAFSPDGRWIAFHSHYGPSDDIWIVPSDLSKAPRQMTAGGYETGWPRWSRDGRFVLYSTAKGREAPGRAYVLRVDGETGELLEPEKEVPLRDFEGEVSHAEWIEGSDEVVLEVVLGPGRKGIYRVRREGGRPRRVHEFECEERTSAISVSPDGEWIAYVAPGPSGYQQVFRLPAKGGAPEQVTFDPSNKTHPAYSPDGTRIAFTVFQYEAQFWMLE
jgi:dipeptidyl aminopeptidase/acylaminoacyl peptidase